MVASGQSIPVDPACDSGKCADISFVGGAYGSRSAKYTITGDLKGERVYPFPCGLYVAITIESSCADSGNSLVYYARSQGSDSR